MVSGSLQPYPTVALNLTQSNGDEFGISDDIKFSTVSSYNISWSNNATLTKHVLRTSGNSLEVLMEPSSRSTQTLSLSL